MTTPDAAPVRIAAAPGRLRRWWREFGLPPRIMGLDVARAVAVLGMVGAHLGASHVLDPLRPETWGGLVHGRSSILFAVLAGISIALMTGRTSIPDAERMPGIRLSLLGRGAAIFMIGLVLELLNTPIAVILTVYGILYVAAIPFVRWSPTRLLLTAGVLAVAGPPMLAILRVITLGAAGPGLGLVVFGSYPVTVWLALVLAGMAIGRTRLDRARTGGILLTAGAALAVVGYGAAALFGGSLTGSGGSSSFSIDAGTSMGDVGEKGMPDVSGWAGYPGQVSGQDPWGSVLRALVDAEPHSGGAAEVIGSGGFAVAVIGLCLLAAGPLRGVLLPFAALGSMPLSAYTGHVISYTVMAGPGGFIESSQVWLWSAVVLLALSTLWSMLWGRGPLERLTARVARAAASVPAA